MASRTYKTSAIVLKKTKLADKDLIVSMLDESGALLQGVAKGARRPGGSLAARLELFSTVDLMMARGRSLDVVCEARLAGPADHAIATLEQSACASPIAELCGLLAQPGLDQPRLFDMVRAALDAIASTPEPAKSLSIAAAALWKVMGQVGFRPSIAMCAACARSIDLAQAKDRVAFSASEGGLTCDSCVKPADALLVEARVAQWLEALIQSRFDEILASDIDVSTSFEVLSLAQSWTRVHVGRSLKSIDFLSSSGLYA